MAEAFDCTNWHVKSHNLICAPTTFSSGRRLNGRKQIRRLPNGYWRGPVTLNPLRGFDMVDFRGWLASLEGSYGEFDLCICDPYALKGEGKTDDEWFKILGLPAKELLCGPVDGKYGIPFDDGTCFLDGTGFEIPEYVTAAVSLDASAGATLMTLNNAAYFLRRGNYFSTSDNYLHVITNVEARGAVSFKPPLRRDISAGEALETQNPKIRVRLSSDDSGSPKQNFGRWTDEITMNVDEVISR